MTSSSGLLRASRALRPASACLVLCGLLLPATGSAAEMKTRERQVTARTGATTPIDQAAWVTLPNCQTTGVASVVVLRPPAHGKISGQEVLKISDDPRCVGVYVKYRMVVYQPAAKYTGPDTIVFDFVYPNGSFERVTATIDVVR